MEEPGRGLISGVVHTRSDSSVVADRRAMLEADLSAKRKRYWILRILVSILLVPILILMLLAPLTFWGLAADLGIRPGGVFNILLFLVMIPILAPLYFLERQVKDVKGELKSLDEGD